MVQTRARYYPNPHLPNMSTSEEQIAELAQVVETLHQQITFLNQQVNNQANDLQAALQANQQAHQANQHVAFALNPIRASTNVIDMTSKDGMKLYKLGLEKVHSLCFDGKPENVNFFRATVHKKALDCGWYDTWGNIFNIVDTSVTPNKTYDIVYQTQEVPLTAIEDFARTNIVNQQNRAAQNNHMAVKSLFASLDEDMMKRMLADEISYTIQNIAVAPLLFRAIISKSEMPGRGQVKVLKDQFKELPDKIKGMDIETFNDHVRGINTSLAAFGHQLPNDDLVQDLLAANKHSDDHHFNEHLKKKEVKWLKGEIDIEFKELLQDGQAEYSSRKYDKESPWGALSTEQQEIIALSAKVDVLKREMAKKKGNATTGNKEKTQNVPNGREKDAWKFNNIINGKSYKAGDKISKNGKEYWWCPHHHDDGMWCRHKPATCTKNPNRSNEHNSPASSPSNCNNNDVANAATEYEDTTEDVEGLIGNFVIESDDDVE